MNIRYELVNWKNIGHVNQCIRGSNFIQNCPVSWPERRNGNLFKWLQSTHTSFKRKGKFQSKLVGFSKFIHAEVYSIKHLDPAPLIKLLEIRLLSNKCNTIQTLSVIQVLLPQKQSCVTAMIASMGCLQILGIAGYRDNKISAINLWRCLKINTHLVLWAIETLLYRNGHILSYIYFDGIKPYERQFNGIYYLDSVYKDVFAANSLVQWAQESCLVCHISGNDFY